MVAASDSTLEQSEGGRAFLQHRVARFGLYGSAIGWFFLAFRVVGVSAFGQPGELLVPSMIYHFFAAASLLSMWVICRRGVRSPTFLRTVDVVAMMLACTFYALMGSTLPAIGMPHYIVILALSYGLITRAVYVPSSARLTVVLTSLCGVPMLVACYLTYRDIPIELWRSLSEELKTVETAGEATRNIMIFAGAWWLCAIAICGGASRVIYGLRREVRDVRKLGQYTLAEKLGEGGMGIVYRATHAMLRRATAIKLLPPDRVAEQSLARFEKEVQLTARLTHPNTVTVFDYGRTPEGVFYYAMELLDGATLADIVEVTGPQSSVRTVHILTQVAGALGEAHAIQLIHRDVKPANIMLVEQGGKPDVAKVLDFGLVKELDPAGEMSLTKADSITGTPQYLAPEAITNPEDVDGRSDIYALGAVAYFLLTGQHVFEGKTVVEVCSAHLHSEPVPPSKRADVAIPEELEALVLRCLSKKPSERPAHAEELVEQLAECEIGPWTRKNAGEWWQQHAAGLAAHRESRLADDDDGRTGLTVNVMRGAATA